MAWIAVDEDGTEYIYSGKPIKRKHSSCWQRKNSMIESFIRLPKGSILKLIGKELTWDDEPVEISD